MSKNNKFPPIKLLEVSRFKFSFPLTKQGTKIAELIGLTKTN